MDRMFVTDAEAADTAPLPTALIATTVKVYAVVSVNPVTIQFKLVLEQCLLVSCTAVATYPVITEPPVEVGATHETVIW